jgi:hypothetical protein
MVKCLMIGALSWIVLSITWGLNNDFKSQNLKPTPLAIVCAVSPE